MSDAPPPEFGGWITPKGYEFDGMGTCKSCGAEFAWHWTKKGNRAPLNRDGISHFATCPNADLYRKPKEPPPPPGPGVLREMPVQPDPYSEAAARDPGSIKAAEDRKRRILRTVYAEPDVWSAGLWADVEDRAGIHRPPSSVSAAFTGLYAEGLLTRDEQRRNASGHLERVHRISPELYAAWDGRDETLDVALTRARLVPKPTSNKRKAPSLDGQDRLPL